MKNNNRNRKEVKALHSEFKIQRISMKIVSVISLILGGTVPIIFWTLNDISATNPMNKNEATLFIWLIFVAIINITFAIITFKDAIEKEDIQLRAKRTRYIYAVPLLLLGGSLPLSGLYFHMWWTIRHRANLENLENI